jgi:MFS family permease
VLLIGSFAGFTVLGPAVADSEMSGASSWATIVGAQSFGLLVGGLLVVRWHASRPILVATIACFANALPIAGLALGWNVALIAGLAFLTGVAMEIFMVYWYTTLQQEVAPESLARVSSYDALGSLALSPLGLVAAGPVSDWIGLEATLWLAVALIVVPTALVLLVPEVRNLRAKPRVHEVDVGVAAEAAAG